MRRTYLLILAGVLTIIFISVGCQDNPAVPDIESQVEPASHQSGGDHFNLGYYQIVIDTNSLETDLIPLRSNDWHFNLTGILNTTMGVSLAAVPDQSDPASGLFVFDITLTHPFSELPNLSGFDVKGILITPGSLTADSNLFADVDETWLENADGYTRWWNPTEFTAPDVFGYTDGVLPHAPASLLTATVNPYKLHADVLNPTDGLVWAAAEPLDSPQGRAVFTAGSSNTRRYQIRFPMDPGPLAIFGYAIDCSWSTPVPNPPVEVPDDFPMNANQREAWRVTFQPTADTLYYDTEAGVGGGVLRLLVNIHDWQGQAAGNTQDEIASVRIDAPDLMPDGAFAAFLNETDTKARYEIDLTGIAIPSGTGPTKVICRVMSPIGSYFQGTAPAPDAPISAYQVITLDIPDPDCSGDASNDWGEAVEVTLGEGYAGQVCLPDDYRDYFWFDVPSGFSLSGEIALYSDAEPTTLGIYDWDQDLIQEVSVSGGSASIPVSNLSLYPGQYYVRVFTSNETQVAPYYLDLAVDMQDITPVTPIEITPPTLFCKPDYAFIHDNYLILWGTLDGLWIYDVTDPSNPVYVYHLYMDMTHKPVMHYPHLYYIHSQGGGVQHISYIDLSDVSSPVYHDSVIESSLGIKDIVMNSEHLIVLTDEEPRIAWAYDYASNPLSPTLLHSTIINAEHIWLFDPEGLDTHLLMNLAEPVDDSIISYNIEDITDWEYAGSYDFGLTVRDIVSQSSFFYVLRRNWGDISSNISMMHHGAGATLILDGNLNWGGNIFYSLAISGGYVYAMGSDGIGVVDISVLGPPEAISVTPVIGTPLSGIVDGNDLYVVISNNGLEVYDIAFPPAPEKVTELPVVNTAYCMVRIDDYLIMGDFDDPYHVLKTLDISDPPNTHLVGSVPLTYGFYSMAYDDGVIVANCGLSEVVIMDASDPTDISVAFIIPSFANVHAVILNGDALYFSNADGQLLVYDVSVPSAPLYQLTIELTVALDYLTINDGLMFGTSELEDVRVLSLSNPWNPTHVGTYTPGDSPHQLSAVGDNVYIVCDSVLEIADISNPAFPIYAGSVLTPGINEYTYQANDGHFVYLTGWYYSASLPAIASIWPPDAPEIIYTFDPWTYQNGRAGIIEHDGYLYISSYHGIRIYDLY